MAGLTQLSTKVASGRAGTETETSFKQTIVSATPQVQEQQIVQAVEQEVAVEEEIEQELDVKEEEEVEEFRFKYIEDEEVSTERRLEIRQAVRLAKAEAEREGTAGIEGWRIVKFLPEHEGVRSLVVKRKGPDGSFEETVEEVNARKFSSEKEAIEAGDKIVAEKQQQEIMGLDNSAGFWKDDYRRVLREVQARWTSLSVPGLNKERHRLAQEIARLQLKTAEWDRRFAEEREGILNTSFMRELAGVVGDVSNAVAITGFVGYLGVGEGLRFLQRDNRGSAFLDRIADHEVGYWIFPIEEEEAMRSQIDRWEMPTEGITEGELYTSKKYAVILRDYLGLPVIDRSHVRLDVVKKVIHPVDSAATVTEYSTSCDGNIRDELLKMGIEQKKAALLVGELFLSWFRKDRTGKEQEVLRQLGLEDVKLAVMSPRAVWTRQNSVVGYDASHFLQLDYAHEKEIARERFIDNLQRALRKARSES